MNRLFAEERNKYEDDSRYYLYSIQNLYNCLFLLKISMKHNEQKSIKSKLLANINGLYFV